MSDKDKILTDIHRPLNSKDFETEKDLEKFLGGLTGKKIPSPKKEELTAKERAQDLVQEAWVLSPEKGKKKVQEALELDPNCIEAYDYLGGTVRSIGKAMEYFKKGIEIGRNRFGGAFLDENKGRFWGILETRPFMRCLQHYADCLYEKGKVEQCVSVLEEMIELNPNDNQGIRDQLGLYYLQLNRLKQFRKLSNFYSKDGGAFHNFNLALFTFKSEGKTSKADELLRKAIAENEFVPPKLTQKKPVKAIPEYYSYGDKSEALYYAAYARTVWMHTLGSVAWLRGMHKMMR